MRFLLLLMILGGVGYVTAQVLKGFLRKPNRSHYKISKREGIDKRLKQSKDQLVRYSDRADGMCPGCKSLLTDDARRCESCANTFWLTRAEATASREATLRRIEAIREELKILEASEQAQKNL